VRGLARHVPLLASAAAAAAAAAAGARQQSRRPRGAESLQQTCWQVAAGAGGRAVAARTRAARSRAGAAGDGWVAYV